MISPRGRSQINTYLKDEVHESYTVTHIYPFNTKPEIPITQLKMDPSLKHLKFYFSYNSVVYKHKHIDYLFFLHGLTCLALIRYVIKFISRSDNVSLNEILMRLEDLASEQRRDPMVSDPWVTARKRRKEDEISELFANAFIPEVKKFFVVPKLHQLPAHMKSKLVKPNEILAGFMDFILQIMNSESNVNLDTKTLYSRLRKKLTTLLIFLGDSPFQINEVDAIKSLLAEFEDVANEAGKLIYLFVFSNRSARYNVFDEGKFVLFSKIDVLNSKIKDGCINFPEASIYTKKTTGDCVDSLLIVNSLLEDLNKLENLWANLQFDSDSDDLVFELTIDDALVDMTVDQVRFDDVADQIETLHEELTFSRTSLEDIYQGRLLGNLDELKEYIIQIRDVAYEAEYIINSQVVGYLPMWYVHPRLSAVIRKLKLAGIKLQQIKKTCNGEIQKFEKYLGREWDPASIDSSNIEVEIVGFEDTRIKVLCHLTGGSKPLQLSSIFGMPGLGKTTAAKKIYNDRFICDYFDRRVWCVVSQNYQRRKIFEDILSSLEEDIIQDTEDYDLGAKIHKTLKGRRYLIVLDDVWDSSTLDSLRIYFPDDENGSRILLTSRIKDVIPSTSVFHKLPLLSEAQSWDLLRRKVFQLKPPPQKIISIGKRIAAKCKGLPLSIVVIAGILTNLEEEKSVWQNVEGNLDSYLSSDDPRDYMKILELSYKELPNHLKLCFLYVGSFPEDTEIPTRKLIPQWIAEGFIQKQGEKSLEHVAESYLFDLINRSLLMVAKRSSDGGIKASTIHDSLRDMCLKIANEENFLKYTEGDCSIYGNHRRLSVWSPLVIPYSPHCRSLTGYVFDPSLLYLQMPSLRVMDLAPISITELVLERVDLLVHMRYLSCCRMPMQHLPLANLVNLEFIYIYNKVDKLYIPSSILKLVRLRKIHIKPQVAFEGGCDSFNTNNLNSLSYICIHEHNYKEILRCSSRLLKLKCSCDGSLFPDLDSLTGLESLKMVFDGLSGRYSRSPFQGNLRKINFPSTLRKLNLDRIGLPWLEMSIVGRLPNLHVLKLVKDAFVGKEWETREGEFQELKFLKIDNHGLNQWTTWSEHFPKLQHIVLVSCKNLHEIPSDLGYISTLHTIEVIYCQYDSMVSAVLIEKEQHDNGNSELNVIINNKSWTKEQLLREVNEKHT